MCVGSCQSFLITGELPMLAPNSKKWWVGAVVGVAASLLVTLEGKGHSRRKESWTPTRESSGRPINSKAEKESKAVEGLADDDSPRSKPGDKAKTQKKKKVTSKSTQSAETMPQ